MSTLRRTMKSATKSLRNHVIFMEVIFTMPLSLVFLGTSYQYGELTPLWGLWIVTVCAALGAVAAVIGWYLILPSIRLR